METRTTPERTMPSARRTQVDDAAAYEGPAIVDATLNAWPTA